MSALGLDPSGARLVSGGYDYDVKLWDFAGMDANLRSFRSIRPCERLVLARQRRIFNIYIRYTCVKDLKLYEIYSDNNVRDDC